MGLMGPMGLPRRMDLIDLDRICVLSCSCDASVSVLLTSFCKQRWTCPLGGSEASRTHASRRSLRCLTTHIVCRVQVRLHGYVVEPHGAHESS